MEEYNKMISSKVLNNIHLMIDDVPQPTMFGGKRQRDFVLPASTDYDYPASLAVGHLKTSGIPKTLGGSFWSDFGETEFLDEDHDQYQMEGGAVWRDADGNIHSTRMPRKIGGKFNLGKKLKPVAPIAKELGMTLAKEGIKEGVKAGIEGMAEGGKRKGLLGKVGKYAKKVGKDLVPIAKDVFKDVIVPEGKKALRDYIRSMGKGSRDDAVDEKFSGDVAYAYPMYPQPYYFGRGQTSGSKIRAMVGKSYEPFHLDKIAKPSANLVKRYSKQPKAKKGRKPKKVTKFEIVEDETEELVPAPKKRGRPKKQVQSQKNKIDKYFGRGYDSESDEEMDGGVLIRDVPSEFHSSVYPPALASYTAGRDAFGRGRASKIRKFLKPAIPIAKELGMTLAKEGIKEGVKSYAKSGSKSGGARGGARGAIVKEVMKKHGLSLPEASKFVKENGLY